MILSFFVVLLLLLIIFPNITNSVPKLTRAINFRVNAFSFPLRCTPGREFPVKSDSKKVILEVYAKKSQLVSENQVCDKSGLEIETKDTSFIALRSLYKEEAEQKYEVDSPFTKVIDVVFNPVALIVSIYVIILGYGKVSQFLPTLFGIFGNKEKSNELKAAQKLADLPYQIFECEVCKMQMRPAKGRADKIFGRESFRCARCGSKAASYFNIDDLTDPRAVERLDRLAREAEGEGDGDGVEGDDAIDDGDEQ